MTQLESMYNAIIFISIYNVGLLTNCLNNLVTNKYEILRILEHIQLTIIPC